VSEVWGASVKNLMVKTEDVKEEGKKSGGAQNKSFRGIVVRNKRCALGSHVARSSLISIF